MIDTGLIHLVPDVVVHAGHTVAAAGDHLMTAAAPGYQLADGLDVQPVQPPGGDKLLRILGWVRWVVYVGGVGALVGAGLIFAVEKYQDRGDSKAAKICLWTIVGSIVSVSAVAILDAAMK